MPVHHAGTPDASLPPGLPSAVTSASPFSLAPAPAAGVIAGLRLTALSPRGQGSFLLADLRGARGTIVAFWATWCTPCQTEVPQLQAREAALRAQGVRLLLVDESEDAATISGWLSGHGVAAGSVWLDEGTSTHDALGLVGLPATALLAADGGVLDRIEGSTQVGPLDADLAALGISAQ